MTEKTTRRGVGILLLAGLGAVWAGGVWWRRLAGQSFDFEDLPGVPGFRRIAGGDLSRPSLDPFIGIGDTEQVRSEPIGDAALCAALFGRRLRAGTVPVASFSDYYCPYCRILTPKLAALEAEGRITVTWHELPLLGPASQAASRAALAADRQEGYAAFHARLMRSRFQPTDAYLREIAESAGLGADRLLIDMRDPAIGRQLARSEAVAERFGFYGTPALVVGRTAVLGAMPVSRLEALIDVEAAADGFPCA